MNAKTWSGMLVAGLLAACGSGGSNQATVHFLAVDGTSSAASVAFQAYSAADPSKLVASAKVTAFSPANVGREFVGNLGVAPGAYVFRAVSYDAQGTALGEGDAEDAKPITTTAGGKTSVSITILAYQHPVDPAAGPVITSFVVTPTGATLPVNTPVALAATVSYDGPNPLSYAWTQDCASGVFSTSTDALTATWSDPAEESCTLTFTVKDTVTGLSDVRYAKLSCACVGTSALGQALVVCDG